MSFNVALTAPDVEMCSGREGVRFGQCLTMAIELLFA